jgi:rRNA maturation RNase YbeY
MLLFFFETNYKLLVKRPIKKWLAEVANLEGKKLGNINIVFGNDDQLLALNNQYLNHNTYTDIITFDYSEKNVLHGDICISVERVKENAKRYKFGFDEELRRVMAHGILHLCGYNDKKNEEKITMKIKEETALTLFNTQFNY